MLSVIGAEMCSPYIDWVTVISSLVMVVDGDIDVVVGFTIVAVGTLVFVKVRVVRVMASSSSSAGVAPLGRCLNDIGLEWPAGSTNGEGGLVVEVERREVGEGRLDDGSPGGRLVAEGKVDAVSFGRLNQDTVTVVGKYTEFINVVEWYTEFVTVVGKNIEFDIYLMVVSVSGQ